MGSTAPILIIDDEEGIRETLTQILEMEGYRVVTASNGQEGMAVLSGMREQPSLILLDLMMPIMDGNEFLECLRKIPALAQIPVVIVSAYRIHPHSLKVTGLINKPFQIETILEVASRHCK